MGEEDHGSGTLTSFWQNFRPVVIYIFNRINQVAKVDCEYPIDVNQVAKANCEYPIDLNQISHLHEYEEQQATWLTCSGTIDNFPSMFYYGKQF